MTDKQKENRKPRVLITLPEGVIEKLDRYADSMGDKQASAAAYLLQSRLDELEREGRIPQSNTVTILENDFELIKIFIGVLAGDRRERFGIDYKRLGELLDIDAEKLSNLVTNTDKKS